MKRKVLSAVLASAMIAATLAGCGSAADTAGSASEQGQSEAGAASTEAASTEAGGEEAAADGEAITLKWAIWDKDITPYWVALKDAYEETHSNVTIEMTDLGSTDYMTVLATELSGSGSDFDVVTIKDVPGYATLVSKNTLEPLDSYIETAGIDLSQYGGVDEQITVDGSLYELPFRNDFWVLFYNKDIFDNAGVDYPTNDMTFEEYDALARQVADPTFGSQVYGTHYHTWRSAVQLFGVLDGQHSILDGNYDFFKPYYELVLKEEDDQICRNYADLSAEGLHYSAAFSGGDVAMMNMGSWFISTMISSLQSGEYDSSLCGNWGIVKYPHAEGVEPGSTLGTITGLAVTSVSDQKQAAFDFVNWVSGEEGAKVMAETGNFPALMNDEVADIIAGLDGFPTDEASKEALSVSNLYLEVPYAENVSEINDILDTYHKSIMNREMTVDEGIAKMNEEVGKVLGQ
ncbi:MAG: sugar ABC transporter substrate-binding protein [Eubacteriales bacterium]|nr:sugar ABC transporter substrate-binding protein [Eubacteriales bacterium]